MKYKILITGGAGFIGSNLLAKLIENDFEITVLDNLSTGSTDKIKPYLRKINFIEGDIRDVSLLMSVTKNIDVVYHLAAKISVPESIANPIDYNNVNIVGTLNLINCIIKNKIGKIIFASSSAIYGDNPVLPKAENMLPEPQSPYAETKISAEHYLKMYSELYDFKAVVFRYFNIYGKNQNPFSNYAAAIPKFIHSFDNKLQPIVYGDGNQTRDFIYIQDVVKYNILALHRNFDKNFNVYNCATGKQTSINELLIALSDLYGSKQGVDYQEKRQGDILHSVADITKLIAEFKFNPEYDINTGMNDMLKNK